MSAPENPGGSAPPLTPRAQPAPTRRPRSQQRPEESGTAAPPVAAPPWPADARGQASGGGGASGAQPALHRHLHAQHGGAGGTAGAAAAAGGAQQAAGAGGAAAAEEPEPGFLKHCNAGRAKMDLWTDAFFLVGAGAGGRRITRGLEPWRCMSCPVITCRARMHACIPCRPVPATLR